MNDDMKKQIEQEERWIDFLEGELEPSLEEDLDRMLAGDSEATALVEEYKGIKTYLDKVERDDGLPREEGYFDASLAKIMAKVGESEIAPIKTGGFNKRNINFALAAVFVCVFSFTAIFNSLDPNTNINEQQVAKLNFGQLLKSAQVKDLSSVRDTVISHESEMDLMLSADLDAINQLSDEELEDIMGRL